MGLPAIFRWLQQQGNVADGEMYRVFNCGIGMVLIVAPEVADAAIGFLRSRRNGMAHRTIRQVPQIQRKLSLNNVIARHPRAIC